MAQGWPVRLAHGRVGVRPLVRSDAARIDRIRAENIEWLAPWDASLPPQTGAPITSQAGLISYQRRKAREGLAMPFGVTVDGELVGQVTVNSITRGSALSASIGYWISKAFAGQQITPLAVAMVSDHLLTTAGLHRVEISIRPENQASIRVVEKLGFDEIGLARGYLHINGEWRDHRIFQVLAGDVPHGLVARLESQSGPTAK